MTVSAKMLETEDGVQKPAEVVEGVLPYKIALLLAFLSTSVTFTLNDMEFFGGEKKKYVDFLQPATYTFAIWPVIILNMMALLVWQFFQGSPERLAKLKAIAPGWCVALLCTSLWNATNNATFDTPVLLAVPVLALASVPVCCWFAHGPVVEIRDWNIDYFMMTAPCTMFFGWQTAAAVVYANIWFAAVTSNPMTKALLAGVCAIVSVIVGVAVTKVRRHALYGGVISWALVGVAVKTTFDFPEMRAGIGEVPTLVLGILEFIGAGVVAFVSFQVYQETSTPQQEQLQQQS